jgi:DNA-binding beta-propeller fold protein YncE
MKKILLFAIQFLVAGFCTQAQITHIKIGESSKGTTEVSLKLVARYQSYNDQAKDDNDIYDDNINSPKSALILEKVIDGKKIKKLYINSLEGNATVVFDITDTFKRIAVIKHSFSAKHAHLFKETDFPGYTFKTRDSRYNVFSGKPVEMTLSNNDRYLWIPYYRRDYDKKAIDPSAVAIIDVLTDKIVRVMPTAPLPKMVSSSPDNKYVAITNWGDNTVHLIDISSGDPQKFKYIRHFVVDYQLGLDFDSTADRDNDCGLCLRGTVFTPDSNYLLVGRMGGGGIAVFDLKTQKYMGTVFGMKNNVRHLVINGDYLYLSSNKDGYVQKTKWKDMIRYFCKNGKNCQYTSWKSTFTGLGARTIACTSDGAYVFATANNESKISILRVSDMKVIGSVKADSYPVGMTIDKENKSLVVTSQGKHNKGGNSVMVYRIGFRKRANGS